LGNPPPPPPPPPRTERVPVNVMASASTTSDRFRRKQRALTTPSGCLIYFCAVLCCACMETRRLDWRETSYIGRKEYVLLTRVGKEDGLSDTLQHVRKNRLLLSIVLYKRRNACAGVLDTFSNLHAGRPHFTLRTTFASHACMPQYRFPEILCRWFVLSDSMMTKVQSEGSFLSAL
jgi:hypothetical protein